MLTKERYVVSAINISAIISFVIYDVIVTLDTLIRMHEH